MNLLDTIRVRLRGWIAPRTVERELQEELEFHIDMQAEANVRAGMAPEEARRQAVLLFGGVEGHKEECRDARGPGLLAAKISWLDLKLAVRMLRRYPGLALVGVLAITVASGIGGAFFQFSTNMSNPDLPVPDGDAIVMVRSWDPEGGAPDPRALHEFAIWSERSETLDDMAASTSFGRSLTTADGRVESPGGAQISASAFRLAGVAPMLGRPLLEEDERPGAPLVVVLGYDAWMRLFDGDRGAVGKELRVGNEPATLVGVMPEGFGFPLNDEVWVPLSDAYLRSEAGAGPGVQMLARLRPGVSPDEAEAELTSLVAGVAEQRPAGERREVRVVRFSDQLAGGMRLAIYGLRFIFVLLMATVCINVATLVYARTATREGEIAIRSALGASRRRIVAQLFVEALVLTLVGSAVGLAIAGWGMGRGMDLFWAVQESRPPFWWNNSLSFATIAYVFGLALVGAVVVGVVPALKATGKRVQPTLTRLSAGGSTLKFGGIWTVVIVFQVALSVAFLPFAILQGQTLLRDSAMPTDFPAGDFATGRLSREWELPPGALPDARRDEERARTFALFDEVRRRLETEPGVVGVAFASRLSGMNHPVDGFEIEGLRGSATAVSDARRVLAVDSDFFRVMDAPVVSGRGLLPGDYASAEGGVLVNQAFVTQVLDGRSPLGATIRFPGRDGADRRHEIVGIVENLEMDAFGPGAHPVIYEPLRTGWWDEAQVFVHLSGDVPTLLPRVHGAVTATDPSLRLANLRTVEETWGAVHRSNRFFAWMMALVAAVALLLSAAGIHALMSFTVARRTREIGIRAALGARPGRIIAAIFSRAFAQLTLGVVLGSLVAWRGLDGTLEQDGPGILLLVAAILLAVGLLACLLPALRALRIQPTEALRSGG